MQFSLWVLVRNPQSPDRALLVIHSQLDVVETVAGILAGRQPTEDEWEWSQDYWGNYWSWTPVPLGDVYVVYERIIESSIDESMLPFMKIQLDCIPGEA